MRHSLKSKGESNFSIWAGDMGPIYRAQAVLNLFAKNLRGESAPNTDQFRSQSG